jgi:phytoene desaturase
MGKLASAMHDVCKEKGVEFLFGEEVEKVIVEGKKVKGVRTTKGEHLADLVIMNADYPHSELELLDDKHRSYGESYWEKKKIAV